MRTRSNAPFNEAPAAADAIIPAQLKLQYGCPCVPLRDEEHAMQAVRELIAAGRGGYSVAINAEKILSYRSRADVRNAIDGSSLPYPDGAGAVLSLRWLHGKRTSKINMPIACLEAAQRHQWRVFVMGAAEEVNEKAVAEIRDRFPAINIVGRMNGYEPDDVKIAALSAAQPDLALLALGSPRQEVLAAKATQMIPGMFIVGCGGALDILAGRIRRAPPFMVNNGLEWLYRLWLEPSRWRRQLVLPGFFIRLAGIALQHRLSMHWRTYP